MKRFKNDIILISSILIIVIICLIIYFTTANKNNITAYIYHDEELIKEVSLSENMTFEVEGSVSKLMIEIRDKSIRVTESGCHDRICINQGFINNSNQTIVCLPNHIIIKLISKEGADIVI